MTEGFFSALQKKRVREVPVGGTFFSPFVRSVAAAQLGSHLLRAKRVWAGQGGIEQGIKSSHGLFFAGVGGWWGAFIPSSIVRNMPEATTVPLKKGGGMNSRRSRS